MNNKLQAMTRPRFLRGRFAKMLLVVAFAIATAVFVAMPDGESFAQTQTGGQRYATRTTQPQTSRQYYPQLQGSQVQMQAVPAQGMQWQGNPLLRPVSGVHGQAQLINPYAMPRHMSTPMTAGNRMIRQLQAVDDIPDTPEASILEDQRIQDLPRARYTLKVVHHHSQLVRTRGKKVRRTFISDPSIAEIVQYTPTEFGIVGLERGKTDVIVWFDQDEFPIIYEVETVEDPNVEEQKRVDYGKLERKLSVLFPNSKVYLIPFSYKLVVKGQAADAQEAAQILQLVRGEVVNQDGNLGGRQPGGVDLRTGNSGSGGAGISSRDVASGYIVNMLEVPGERQIMVRVRIAQLSRSQARNMGVDFNVLFNNARHSITASMGGVPSQLSGIFENGEFQTFLNWLASNGTAKIIAEPALAVLSGHTASFISGGEFPVPTALGLTGGQTTSFRGFGTTLSVTPSITDKDMIRMQITPEFSAINAGNGAGGVPGTDVRRVSTSVELREGQTIVLGGLISRQTNTEVTRIPVLGEIPWIGPRLFNTKLSTEDETELLIVVTPELVRPYDPEEAPPMPGFNTVHPTDDELYYHALTEGAPRMEWYQVSPLGTPTTANPVGYAMSAPQTPNFGPAAIPTGTFANDSLAAPPSYGTYGRWAAPAMGGQQMMMVPYGMGSPMAMPQAAPQNQYNMTNPAMTPSMVSPPMTAPAYPMSPTSPQPTPNGTPQLAPTPDSLYQAPAEPNNNGTGLPPIPTGATGNMGGIRQLGGLRPSYRSGGQVRPIRYSPQGPSFGPSFPVPAEQQFRPITASPSGPSYRSGRVAQPRANAQNVDQRRQDFLRYGTAGSRN